MSTTLTHPPVSTQLHAEQSADTYSVGKGILVAAIAALLCSNGVAHASADAYPTGQLVFQDTDGWTSVIEDGKSDSVLVSLTSQPTADVRVTSPYSTSDLTFTPVSWSAPQAIVLDKPAFDGTDEFALRYNLASTDPAFKANQEVGIPVTAIAKSWSGPSWRNSGPIMMYECAKRWHFHNPEKIGPVKEGDRQGIKLCLYSHFRPAGTVRAHFSTTANLRFSPTTVEFDSSNWRTEQTVTLTAPRDFKLSSYESLEKIAANTTASNGADSTVLATGKAYTGSVLVVDTDAPTMQVSWVGKPVVYEGRSILTGYLRATRRPPCSTRIWTPDPNSDSPVDAVFTPVLSHITPRNWKKKRIPIYVYADDDTIAHQDGQYSIPILMYGSYHEDDKNDVCHRLIRTWLQTAGGSGTHWEGSTDRPTFSGFPNHRTGMFHSFMGGEENYLPLQELKVKFVDNDDRTRQQSGLVCRAVWGTTRTGSEYFVSWRGEPWTNWVFIRYLVEARVRGSWRKLRRQGSSDGTYGTPSNLNGTIPKGSTAIRFSVRGMRHRGRSYRGCKTELSVNTTPGSWITPELTLPPIYEFPTFGYVRREELAELITS